MKDYAFRAARKPSRGGVRNVHYVQASVEDAPPELARIAGAVHVNFAWAALLRGILAADQRILAGLAALLTPGGALHLVLTYDASHDHAAGVATGTPSLSPEVIEGLRPDMAATGLSLDGCALLSREDALAIPSTWGRRLLHGRERQVYAVSARLTDLPR